VNHLYPAASFIFGFVCAAFIFLAFAKGRRGPRSTDPPIAPSRGPGRRVGDAGKIVDTARSNRDVDASIAEYERHRNPPQLPPHGAEEALRRVHAMEQSRKFEHDMMCPECGAVAPAGSRAVIHMLSCSETKDPEPLL
jgi:hypothetical protein